MRLSTTNEKIEDLFEKSSQIIIGSKFLSNQIKSSIEAIVDCLEKDNKVVLFGNGGSAADAQHMAAEFIGRYKIERDSLPAIALTTDSSILTAIGNDYSFDQVFSRQCESLVKKGDVIIAISTSGRSKNVLLGIDKAKENGAKIISITGGDGGQLKDKSDIVLMIPSTETPRIQEGHRTVIHIICELVEEHFKRK